MKSFCMPFSIYIVIEIIGFVSMMMFHGVASDCSFTFNAATYEFDNCLELTDDFATDGWKVYWRRIKPANNLIEIAVRAKGDGYLAAGFGTQMVGSKAVVGGWNGLTVQEYLLNGKDSNQIVVSELNIETPSFDRVGGDMTLIFSIPYGVSPVPAGTAVDMIFALHSVQQTMVRHDAQKALSVNLHLPVDVVSSSLSGPSTTPMQPVASEQLVPTVSATNDASMATSVSWIMVLSFSIYSLLI